VAYQNPNYRRDYYLANRERLSAANKEWYLENKESVSERGRRYREANAQLLLEKRTAYKTKNRGRLNESQKARYRKNLHDNRRRAAARQKERRVRDSAYRILVSCRNRIVKAIRRGDKSAPTLELLGCSPEHLKVWLTFYFQPGMTWKNYGKVWHIDHTKPCAAFDLSEPAQQRECFQYTNLQPMFAAENLSKGASWVA
jgi:hypothetical protein